MEVEVEVEGGGVGGGPPNLLQSFLNEQVFLASWMAAHSSGVEHVLVCFPAAPAADLACWFLATDACVWLASYTW